MTAPNAAVGALPGWRGTDPDGGTWVLTDRGNRFPWFVVHADGSWQWMTQEAAEAAGLVRLIPAVGYHYDERGEDVVPDDAAPASLDPEGYVTVPGFGKWLPRGLKYLFEQVGVPEGGCAVMEAVDAVLDGRPPAPLDPGNREHLRQVADFIEEHARRGAALARPEVEYVNANSLRRDADRLDRERAEAEQDAADRKLATEKARAKNPAEWETLPEFDQNTIIDMVMTGIRAADERAERARQAAGQ